MVEGRAGLGRENVHWYSISKGFYTKVIFGLQHMDGVQHRLEQVFITVIYLHRRPAKKTKLRFRLRYSVEPTNVVEQVISSRSKLSDGGWV